MKLLKPNWVTHDGKPIFSIDIHPDGSRFATAGQGDSSGSGKVVIWNMGPVRNEDIENNPNVPKMLCQIDNHLACVNCVRWSHNGKYLASASDDKLVMIWQAARYATMSSSFGSSGKVSNIESWKALSTLRGHSGDILDVSWSSHDAWLASCSIDNTIIIWNALKFPEQLSILKGHTGLIKGVSWDPVGKFLASQSDDKTVRVWRTYDWQQETCIKEPFVECGGTTHILRLDWSPDGQYLVSAHAMNNSGPTAQIIERSTWKTGMDFVGHRKAITCVRFNPRIMQKPKESSEKSKTDYMVCGIGSKDRSLSIWATNLKRPVVIVHDLFSNSILDITWSSCGYELMCCSWDGTISYLGFSSEELGIALTEEDKISLHRKLYGKSALSGDLCQKPNVIIESADMIDSLDSTHKVINKKNSQNFNTKPKKIQSVDEISGKELLDDRVIKIKENEDKINKESSHLNGNCFVKKSKFDRIKNVADESCDEDKTKNNNCEQLKIPDEAKVNLEDINLEDINQLNGQLSKKRKLDDDAKSIQVSISPNINYLNKNILMSPVKIVVQPLFQMDSSCDYSMQGKSLNKQIETRTKDGKRRITPIFIPPDYSFHTPPFIMGSIPENTSFSTSNINLMSLGPVFMSSKECSQIVVEKKDQITSSEIFNRPKEISKIDLESPNVSSNNLHDFPKTSMVSASIMNNQISTKDFYSTQNKDKNADNQLELKNSKTAQNISIDYLEELRKKKDNKVKIRKLDKSFENEIIDFNNKTDMTSVLLPNLSTSKCLLPPLQPFKGLFSCMLSGFHSNFDQKLIPVIEATNNFTSSHVAVHRLRCSKQGKVLWETILTNKIVALSGNNSIVCVGREDRCLSIYSSKSGRLIIPAMVVNGQLSLIHFLDNFLLAVTSIGRIYVWNVLSMKCTIKDESIESITNSQNNESVSLKQIHLLEKGTVVVSMSNGHSYTYDINLACWISLTNNIELAGLSYTNQSLQNSYKDSYLTRLFQKSRTTDGALKLLQNNSTILSTATLVHLESQVASSLVLKSHQEYRLWLLAYVRHLVKEDYDEKLCEVCQEIFNSITSKKTIRHDPLNILSLDKTELLQEILNIIKSKVQLQRIYCDYQEQLTNICQKS